MSSSGQAEMSLDVNTSFCRALVDEWVRHGVRYAFVAPGSRSTPMTLALARDPRLRVEVVIDERSAAFMALGAARASGVPAIVVCTSGSAAAHFHPAVVEADHARVPLIVLSADRPPELRDTGAGQTIDQQHLYGRSVRWYCDPGPPEAIAQADAFWRSLASRAVGEARGPRPGPVHLNLPLREPLVPTGGALVDTPGRPDGLPWTVSSADPAARIPAERRALAALATRHEHGVITIGWGCPEAPAVARALADAAGWPVLADPIGNGRVPGTVAHYEALLRAPGFADDHRPSALVQFGAPLTSKVTNAWLASVREHVVVDPYDAWLDPRRSAVARLRTRPLDLVSELLGPPGAWRAAWMEADRRVGAALGAALTRGPVSSAHVARTVHDALPEHALLHVASSMAVRDVEWFCAARPRRELHCNRGTNGIDGAVSSALGLAVGADGLPVVALLGDLAFLHDTNGLIGAAGRDVDLTIVVADDDGGAIFSFLPQAEGTDAAEFERLFGTPHGLDLVAVARAHGVEAQRVDTVDGLSAALAASIDQGGVRVLVVPCDRGTTVAQHQALWAVAAAALSD